MKVFHYLLLCLSAIFFSCFQTKTLLKGNEVYSYNAPVAPPDPAPAPGPAPVAPTPGPLVPEYQKYHIIKKHIVTIKDNGTYLMVSGINPALDPIHYAPSGGPVNITASRHLAAWKDQNINTAYFPESADPSVKKGLWYYDKKFVLQTASIPLKIRPAVRTDELRDSIPSQTETGFNIGILTGFKFTWNRFRASNNIFGQNTDRFSITSGIIFAVGAADLNTNTTRPRIDFARKAAMISIGGAAVIGINSINLGYAFGWDHATATASSSWLYQGKIWHGIIVSLDLIK